ncbi:hypothetical protein JYQ30_09380 [Curtobacterium flaccumfaciens pv. flaccumfaciens]|nr:hypothetical protein [Curtobacterium flaccumfaciens pv. flaccumfaciens]
MDLQIALINEIRSKVDSDRKRRAFTQSLVYFVFVALGTVGSGWSVGYVTGFPEYGEPFLWVITVGLLILNLAALILAGSFVAKSGAALFPQFDRDLIPKRKSKPQQASGTTVTPGR